MSSKRLQGLIVIVIVIMLAGYIFIKPAFNYLSGYLSKSEQVQANILLVEGWLSEGDLEIAFKEFENNKYDHIITTGLEYEQEYLNMYENGYLIFYPKLKSPLQNETHRHSIAVDAYGSLNYKEYAHFNLFVNDSLIADFYADKRTKRYSAEWIGDITGIDSLMVQFTNDRLDEHGDLNLFIKDIVIDSLIVIPYLHNSEYDISVLDGQRRIVNNFTSTAQIAKNMLLSKGIDSALITAVPCERVKINRTLTSALAFRDWIKKANIKVTGINIISRGTHARRTWMTYNRVLNEKYKIGIISISDNKDNYSLFSRVLKTLRETIGIVYYWIILIPY